MLGTSFQSSYPQSFAEFIWQSFLFYTKDRCQRCMDSVSSMPWVPFFSIYYIQPGGCSSITCPLFWGVSWNFIEKMRWELAFINKLSQFCHITSHHWAPQAKKNQRWCCDEFPRQNLLINVFWNSKNQSKFWSPTFKTGLPKWGTRKMRSEKAGDQSKSGLPKSGLPKKIAKKWVTR